MGKPPPKYRYNEEWEKEWGWVRGSSDPYRACCTICTSNFKAKKDVVRTHGISALHKYT